jgi:hypothetical protein
LRRFNQQGAWLRHALIFAPEIRRLRSGHAERHRAAAGKEYANNLNQNLRT